MSFPSLKDQQPPLIYIYIYIYIYILVVGIDFFFLSRLILELI